MHVIKSLLLHKILAGQPTSVLQKQDFLILCTGKLRHGGRTFWQQLPHWVSTRSTPYPDLGLEDRLPLGNYCIKPQRPNQTQQTMGSVLQNHSDKIKGLSPSDPRDPYRWNTLLVTAFELFRLKHNAQLQNIFFFGSSQSCSKGTCEIHSWVILEWSGPDGSSQMWPSSS